VFATLKGSLFAIPDATLLRFRHLHARLHPFRKPAEDEDPDFQPVKEALALLASLHRARNHRPVAVTVNLLLEATRAHAGFALRPAGRQALANVSRIAELARSFEMEGGISFRGFVDELEQQAEKAESVEAPVQEEGAEGVRLMTVHGAKGLEFPVVILGDMTANLAAAEPERYIDGARGLCAMRLLRCAPAELLEHQPEEHERELSEGVRVAYVAATRARDLLVAPVVGDQEMEGWLSPLNKALFPNAETRQRPRGAQGCPKFGNDTIEDRPAQHMSMAESTVKPGMHRPRAGDHNVVWWDPAKLKLGVEPDFGLPHEEILAEDQAGRGVESLARYSDWLTKRSLTIEDGRRAEVDVVLASETNEPPPGFDCEVVVESVSRPEGRPGGRRFGTLVHAVLRDTALDGDGLSLGPLAAAHGRALGATVMEMDAARDAVAAALAHPLLARARAASRCHRELPVLLPLEGGKVLEGVLDLAFLEQGTWTIVDFKTDADQDTPRRRYERQLRWYALALSRLTGLPARGVLLCL